MKTNHGEAALLEPPLPSRPYLSRRSRCRNHRQPLAQLQEIRQKLGVRNRVEAAIRATNEGWI